MTGAFKREAKLVYHSGSFDVVQSGDHVVCAVSGDPISVEALNYWSAELQEAYAKPALMIERLRGMGRL
ncbi:DUF2093 domain-containing protein [Brevundimonas sp.]